MGDVEDRYGGDYEVHLTDEGRTQAERLAQKLNGKGIEKIFTSSKVRAKETAEIVSKELGCVVEEIIDLRERNQHGILTGMLKAEARQKYPDLPPLLKDYRNTIEGAEDYEGFANRVKDALIEIGSKNYKTVAVITHGGPIKATLRGIEYAFNYEIDDCAYAVIKSEGGRLTVLELQGIKTKSQ